MGNTAWCDNFAMPTVWDTDTHKAASAQKCHMTTLLCFLHNLDTLCVDTG